MLLAQQPEGATGVFPLFGEALERVGEDARVSPSQALGQSHQRRHETDETELAHGVHGVVAAVGPPGGQHAAESRLAAGIASLRERRTGGRLEEERREGSLRGVGQRLEPRLGRDLAERFGRVEARLTVTERCDEHGLAASVAEIRERGRGGEGHLRRVVEHVGEGVVEVTEAELSHGDRRGSAHAGVVVAERSAQHGEGLLAAGQLGDRQHGLRPHLRARVPGHLGQPLEGVLVDRGGGAQRGLTNGVVLVVHAALGDGQSTRLTEGLERAQRALTDGPERIVREDHERAAGLAFTPLGRGGEPKRRGEAPLAVTGLAVAKGGVEVRGQGRQKHGDPLAPWWRSRFRAAARRVAWEFFWCPVMDSKPSPQTRGEDSPRTGEQRPMQHHPILHTLFASSLVLLGACSLFTSGGGAETPEATPHSAHLVLPELHLEDGRLHATIWYEGFADGTPLQATLRGPGVDAELAVPTNGTGTCSRLSFRSAGGPYELITDPTSPCSWAVDAPAAGPWTIELGSGDAVLDTAEFHLVEVPKVDGSTTWIVDPADRVGTAYLHPAGIVTWVAVPASVQSSAHALVEVRNGSDATVTTYELQGPAPGPGAPRPAIEVRPLVVRNGPAAASEQVAVLLAPERQPQAWRFVIDRAADPDRIEGIELWRTKTGTGGDWDSFYGGIAPMEPTGPQVELAVQEAGQLSSAEREERLVCAWLDPETSERVTAIGRELRELFDQINAAERRAGEAEDSLEPDRIRNFTQAERRSLRATMRESRAAADEHRQTKAQLEAEREQILRGFEPGCLAAHGVE